MTKKCFAAKCLLAAQILLACVATPCAVADSSAFRTVTDLRGNKVTLPPADQLQRVVIVAPPLFSAFVSLGMSRVKLVGAHKAGFTNANKTLLDMFLPGWRGIPTGFLTGFRSNTEALLTLHPDLILVYGNFQKKGLEGLTVPVLDFYLAGHDNQAASIASENLMTEVFQAGKSSLEEEWNRAQNLTADLLSQVKGLRKKGMMIAANTGDKLMVMGAGSCGDDWLKKSGLVNVADVADTQGGGREVTMEQVYAWNPDRIYIMWGFSASKYKKEQIPGQNWHHVEAALNGAVYDMPRGLTNWGTARADSPLTLLWLVSKNYPHLLSDDDFSGMMKAFYLRRYNIDLSCELMEEILYPNGK